MSPELKEVALNSYPAGFYFQHIAPYPHKLPFYLIAGRHIFTIGFHVFHEMESGLVNQAVVAVKGAEDKRLVGYVVAVQGYEKELLLTYMRDHLPEYMVPQFICSLMRYL